MGAIDPQILQRYAKGECSPGERTLVERWLDQNEADTAFEDDTVINHNDEEQIKQTIWADVKPGQHAKRASRKISLWRIGAAASVLVLLVSGLIFKLTHRPKTLPTTQTADVYTELSVPKGRKAVLTLQDGTEIHLNSGSTLKYPQAFTGRQRVVYLSGEAYFRVKHDPRHPFIIHTANTDTRVLGTVFNVKAYPEDARTTLTVEEGRVQFALKSDPAKHLILTVNQQGVAVDNQHLQLQSVTAATYTGWKDEKLVFDNLSLVEMAPLLNRWYNLKVVTGNREIEKQRFTGTYTQEPVSTIAQDISLAFHCRYKIVNNQLTFN